MNDRLAAAELDRYDLAILGELQRDNPQPQRLIAETVGLSAPAVQRRIRRLEAAGVIRANVAVVDPLMLGQAITLLVTVEMESERSEILDAAKASFAAAAEVQQCYDVTGEIDFVLVVLVKTMAEYETLTKRLFFANNTSDGFVPRSQWTGSRSGCPFPNLTTLRRIRACLGRGVASFTVDLRPMTSVGVDEPHLTMQGRPPARARERSFWLQLRYGFGDGIRRTSPPIRSCAHFAAFRQELS